MIRKIEFYRTGDGKCPVEEFLDSLPSKTAQKAAWGLQLLETMDIVPDKLFKQLKGTIYGNAE